jgi:hypothetical protein
MFGDDDGDGLLDRLTGGSSGTSINQQEIWRDVRENGRTLNNRSQKLRSQANDLRSVESGEFADPTSIADEAEMAADQAMNVAQGTKVAVNANNETALEDEEAYDIIESVQVKVEGLAGDLTDTYESVTEYGDKTYDQFRDVLKADEGLGVDVELPDQVDWTSGHEATTMLRGVQTEYEKAARGYRRQAKKSQDEEEKTEDRADQYREIQEDLEDSMWDEEYGEIAETLEEKADSDDPVTPEEKAEKAEAYASIAEFARSHIGDVQKAASHVAVAEERAYHVSDNLASLLRNAGYSRENAAGEWRNVD